MKTLLSAVIACCLISPAFAYEIPDLGNVSLNQNTDPGWLNISAGFTREIRTSKERLNDPVTENYLTQLTRRLSPKEARSHLFVINSPSINAFAGPGDIIVVHTGLFEQLEDENELASVLAHELSHQQQHHLWRRIQLEKNMRGPVALGAILATALGAWNPAVGQSALSVGATWVENTELKYSRAFEHEADRMGIELLAKANFDTQSMAGFFGKLSDHEKYTLQRSIPEILRTHPVTATRIADATNHANQFPARHPESSLDFLLVKARLHNMSTAFQKMEVENFNKQSSLKVADEYGYALALMKTQQSGLAIKKLEKLRQQYPNNFVLNFTLAEFYDEAQQEKPASLIYSHLNQLDPYNGFIVMAYGQHLLNNEHPAEVVKLLKQFELYHTLSPEACGLLANAYGKLHQLDQAYFYQARLMDQLSLKMEAKDYYAKAKKQSKNPVLMAQVEHQLRVM